MIGFPCLVLGTNNRKKGQEMAQLLAPLGLQLKTLAEISDSIDVEETGSTFAENAALKATEQARHLRQFVIGEDSGLCVDALDGAPGVFSARFSGPEATDATNNALLLSRLADVVPQERTAYYVCHMTLSDPDGNVLIDCEDYCRGRILKNEAGKGGFGYDPLFEIPEYHRTFGQLGNSVKGVLSHRSRAIRRFVPELLRIFHQLEAKKMCRCSR